MVHTKWLGLTFPWQNERAFTRGFRQNELAIIDREVANFMGNFIVPGMSIAMTRNGYLAYAKAFGVAERWNRWSIVHRSVSVWDIFRIASVSKPITAVAIMSLIEQGLIALDSRIFGNGGVLGNDFGFSALPPGQSTNRIASITVQHLLEHTCGGWPNVGPFGDPMQDQLQMDHKQLITWVLANRPLDNDPGTRWAYSNFGFCLLGRVIEKVTGERYEDFVKDKILRRCDITNMHIAGHSLSDRRSDEVRYYGDPPTDDPYTVPVPRGDANGGWLASAVDLVRFAVHVDGINWIINYGGGGSLVPTISASTRDILESETIKTMTTRTTAEESPGQVARHAKGWFVNEGNWWHFGNMIGTTATLVRRGDGVYCWAALSNIGQGNAQVIMLAQEALMTRVFESISQWPTQDLFPLYDDRWWWLKVAIGNTWRR
jgi:CubicO group peptidase (beta-lactamase class C family)